MLPSAFAFTFAVKEQENLVEVARTVSRAQFVGICPPLLLLTGNLLHHPDHPQPTNAGVIPRRAPQVTLQVRDRRELGCFTLLRLAKTQLAFPSMITVGRTHNNDVVVPDVTVSRAHAYFKLEEGGMTLADAGSRNGTWLRGRRLPANEAAPVVARDLIRFGSIEFTLVEPGACWDILRQLRA